MRKYIFIISTIICQLFNADIFAQAPNAIPYQGVARDAAGNILAAQAISLRVSIHDITANGTVVFSETHSTTTNSLGLFNVNIGSGTAITGTLAAVNWGSGAKFMQVEMDATGGTSYIDMGTTQLNSVPYALYAASSADNKWMASGNDISNINTGNIGIGTTTPAKKLDVAGDALINGLTIGRGAGDSYYNTVAGNAALNANTTGVGNTALGVSSLNTNTTGNNNTALGLAAMEFNLDGGYNTAVGRNALRPNTTGSRNTALGEESLITNLTGNNNTMIGYQADVLSGNLTNSTAIGANAKVNASNSLVLGNNVNVGIGTTTPVNKLDVVGNIKATTTITAGALTTAGIVTNTAAGLLGTTATVPIANGGTGSATKNFVDLTTTQTVAGVKTWSGNAVFNGNVGIGTATPSYTLEVANTGGYGMLHSAQGVAIGTYIDANGGWLGTASNHKLNFFTNNGSEAMTIGTTGNVGIGTTTPAKKLDVAGDALINGLTIGRGGGSVFYNTAVGISALNVNTTGSANTTVGINGLVANTTGSFNTALGLAAMQGNVGGSRNTAVGYNGLISNTGGNNNTAIGYGADVSDPFLTNATAIGYNAKVAASNCLVLGSNAFVGIGTTQPIFPLDIETVSSSGLTSGYLYDGSGPRAFTGFHSVSVWASGTIAATNFMARSDKRVKHILRQSNSQADLNLLNKIKVTDYTYIDQVANGNQEHKKVIAQDVEQVLPAAVNKSVGFIPDIFCMALNTRNVDGRLQFFMPKPHGLKKGDKIKWISDENQSRYAIVENVISGSAFEIRDDKQTKKAFVYGKQVDDLRSVDYEAISMLNVSATQELYKMIIELREQNNTLRKENTSIKAENEKQAEQTNKRLKALEEKLDALQTPVAVSGK